jgi:microcystin-dependent protein
MATYPPPIENLPVFNSLLFTEAQSGSSSSSSSPTGSTTAYTGLTAPAGWLMCDGSEFNEAQFVALYNILKSNQTPDLRGCFLRASGTNSTYKNAYGSYITGQDVGSYAKDSIGTHNHSYNYFEAYNGATLAVDLKSGSYKVVESVSSEKFTGSTDDSTSASSETYPPNFAINYTTKT